MFQIIKLKDQIKYSRSSTIEFKAEQKSVKIATIVARNKKTLKNCFRYKQIQRFINLNVTSIPL